MTRTAVYPGTFDPITKGHLDILKRGLTMFDSIVVAVAIDTPKTTLFTVDERLRLVKSVTRRMPGVRVSPLSGLLVSFAKNQKAVAILRGLREVSDFEYEFQMALMNRRLSPKLETVFLMPSENYTFLNSSIIRQISQLGGNISEFVPTVVEKALKKKYLIQQRNFD